MRFTIELKDIPRRTSEVIIEERLLGEIGRVIESCPENRVPYWIWDENVWRLWGKRVTELGWPDEESGRVVLFPASEVNKRLSALERLAGRLVRAGADRQSAIVAVGGGVTGDVAGFLASIYMRGIMHHHVPTTLLAQVDSGIGGKTGVDLPEGKNLIGAIHQPRTVWMDPVFLETLPPEEFRQGMAEVIKTAMIGDELLWKFLESHGEAIAARERGALLRIISACCMFKAQVVEEDEMETGRRRILNLGHTVGHAIEKAGNYRICHGDAVALGLIAATTLSVRLGKLSAGDLERLEGLCGAWGLPVRIPRTFQPEDLLTAMKADKKRIGDTIHFILPVRIGGVEDISDLDLRELKETLVSISSS